MRKIRFVEGEYYHVYNRGAGKREEQDAVRHKDTAPVATRKMDGHHMSPWLHVPSAVALSPVLVRLGVAIGHEAQIIRKEIAGVPKEHSFIRADTFGSKDEAAAMAVEKGKLIIDERGDRMFG